MGGKQRILLLDSDPYILILLRRFLEEAGYDTHITSDVEKATSLLRNEMFTAVIVGEHPGAAHCLEVAKKLNLEARKLDGPESRMQRDELHALALRAVMSTREIGRAHV